ncbi:MAG: transporter ATP-binding protein [Caulobacteraceae bacterium]|nr:transporter ATP-binding protein [Caulobacteraceae bacterium]
MARPAQGQRPQAGAAPGGPSGGPPGGAPGGRPKGPSVFGLLKPYRPWILLLIALTVLGSGLGLFVPKITASAIDAHQAGDLDLSLVLTRLGLLTLGVFLANGGQIVVQTYASEKVARDLRTRLAGVISTQDYASVEALVPARLLTNLTSDVDAIKTFVAQALASLISSVFLILGASALLLYLNWKLALAVLLILPFIGATFYLVLARVRKLFTQAQGIVDGLNKVLNENILGAALIRLLNAQQREYGKFLVVNEQARGIGMQILRQFASMIPVITFLTNLATLTILALGGHFVITGSMSLGEFTAFNAYLVMLIFPIIIIGFMSTAMAQAQASYGRLQRVFNAPPRIGEGGVSAQLSGAIEVKHLNLQFEGRQVLKDVSLAIQPRARTAIIGPTAGGKSQLFYLMTGLITPTSGEIDYDGRPIGDYARKSLHAQMGFVFQDSVLFNLTLRENIAFSPTVDDASLDKAIRTAELHDFIDGLPKGLDTLVSERGVSLSGGQKQRVMLARALAIDPTILFLDDFTARVDSATEAKILANVRREYPNLTLISITQKIAPVEDYDQIILLMEGEVLAQGTHRELCASSPEYAQILDSQKSTERYEAA